MFRFTIRDLLWLMVVVGLACALVINMRLASALQNELEESKRIHKGSLQASNIYRLSLQREVEKLSGRKYRGMTWWVDDSNPDKYSYEIEYSDGPEQP